MDFSQRLKSQRILHGWSQAMLAEKLGTTANTISVWERGISLPSPFFREKLCTLLNMGIRELGLLPTDEEPNSDIPNLNEQAATSTTLVSSNLLTEEGMHREHALVTEEKAHETSTSKPVISILQPPPPHRLGRKLIIGTGISLLLIASSLGLALLTGLLALDPYSSHLGKLTLNDSLQKENDTIGWSVGWNANHASCEFKEGAYHSQQPLQGYFHACMAQKTDFHNFAYEMEITIDSGDYSGIIFRARNSKDDKYYLFRISIDSKYALKQYVDRVDDHAILLAQGSTNSIHPGLHQRNLVAVIAQDDLITLYVNKQQIGSVHDSSYLHGQIGLFAGNDTHTPAHAVFRNIKVWTW